MCRVNKQKTNFDYRKLEGKIIEKYKTRSAFADNLGISRTHLSNILNNKSDVNSRLRMRIVQKLDIDTRDIGEYFFTLKV